MDSCWMREVTRLRSRALRWAESRPRCLYCTRPPTGMFARWKGGWDEEVGDGMEAWLENEVKFALVLVYLRLLDVVIFDLKDN